jgi:ribonuclease E
MPERDEAAPQERASDRSESMWEPTQPETEHGGAYPHHDAQLPVAHHEPQAAEPRAEERAPARPAAAAEPEPAAPVPPVAAPAPRRGSTVREPAPTSFSFGGESTVPAPAPQPEPPPPSTGSETEEARPRRAGWWSKRVLGKG